MASRIERAWRGLRQWYEKNLPACVFEFKKGASAAAIARAEKRLGLTFPDEIRESYLICNGLQRCGLAHFGYFNSLKDMVSQWEFFRDIEKKIGPIEWPPGFPRRPDPAIKKVYWNRLRIPLTTNLDNNYVMLDLDPSKKGQVGQIIRLERLKGPRVKLGDCLSEWLESFTADLKAGKYLFDEDAESLVHVDDW